MDAIPRFSLIIPAYNEEVLLPRLLTTVAEARRRYAGGFDAVEVIIADNESADATAEIAEAWGCRVVRVERRVIGAVRNGGAAAASGEILCFVDADARIHPDTFGAIDRALATGKVVAGATGVTLERWSLGIAITYALFLPMLVLTGMDTGVVFCPRENFELVGGYSEERLFAEDVAFLLSLRQLGRRRGQRLARVTEAKAIASMRKFDEYGDWHYLTQMPRLALLALKSRTAMNEFAERYWYGNSR